MVTVVVHPEVVVTLESDGILAGLAAIVTCRVHYIYLQLGQAKYAGDTYAETLGKH